MNLHTTNLKSVKRRILISPILIIFGFLSYWYTSKFCVPEGTPCAYPGSYFGGSFALIVGIFSVGVLIISLIEYFVNKITSKGNKVQ